MTIFHPYRFKLKTREFYYSPHFHLIGFGNLRRIAESFIKDDGVHPVVSPDVFYEGLLDDHGGWHPVNTVNDWQYARCSFEYHLIWQVNDILDQYQLIDNCIQMHEASFADPVESL